MTRRHLLRVLGGALAAVPAIKSFKFAPVLVPMSLPTPVADLWVSVSSDVSAAIGGLLAVDAMTRPLTHSPRRVHS